MIDLNSKTLEELHVIKKDLSREISENNLECQDMRNISLGNYSNYDTHAIKLVNTYHEAEEIALQKGKEV